MSGYVLAMDQGTTSSRAILFDRDGSVVGIEKQEFTQHYPQPGWVEHNPEDIWFSQLSAAVKLVHNSEVRPELIHAIGITNQRETTILWDRRTGVPVSNAIVWQDRRTADICQRHRQNGAESYVREATGLTLDPYFSATKIAWQLESTPGLRVRAERGEIAFGNVDSFLLWRLTNGRIHATDVSNASRTLLYNIHHHCWDATLLELFAVPEEILPTIGPSCHVYGETDASLLGASIPIGGVAGDQHAALFGQACINPGMTKNTYGTGCFALMNTGAAPRTSNSGLLTTIAWDPGNRTEAGCISGPCLDNSNCVSSRIHYALEGSVFVAGAAVQWLRDELQIIHNASDIEPLAASVSDTGGVYFVPAFVGLGAPYWDPDARGALMGLSRGTSKAHIARAVLEAACFQTCDVLDAMKTDACLEIPELRVDGGMTENNTLMQLQADLLGVPVVRPVVTETTAMGAAFLAGIATGVWRDEVDTSTTWRQERLFEPAISDDERVARRSGWENAVTRIRTNA